MPEGKVEGPAFPWGLRNSHDIWPYKGHDDDDDDDGDDDNDLYA